LPEIERDEEWIAYLSVVASAAELDRSDVSPDARLVEDLGLDSLALTELVVSLGEIHGAALLGRLEEQRWPGLTVKGCWDELVKGQQRPPRVIIRREPH
jgi:hypothetical protein